MRRINWFIMVALLLTATVAMSQPDLRPWDHIDWDAPLVPRLDLVSGPTVDLPTILPYDTFVYLNYIGINDAPVGTESGFRVDLQIDGEDMLFSDNFGILVAGQGFSHQDIGPFIYSAGGRHVLSVHYDTLAEVPESDETNNDWGHQYVWEPPYLTNGLITYLLPPDPLSGQAAVSDGSFIAANCEGYRISPVSGWEVVVVGSNVLTNDVDLHLYQPSLGISDGFVNAMATSVRTAGLLDAILVNNVAASWQEWDFGARRYGAWSGSGWIELVRAQVEMVNTAPVELTWSAGEALKAWAYNISGPLPTEVMVALDVPPGSGPFHLSWFPNYLNWAGIDDASASHATTNANGEARLFVTPGNNGEHAVIVYHDPVDGAVPSTGTLRVMTTPADLVPSHQAGWAGPVVPTPTPANLQLVSEPDTLHGEVLPTYVSYAMRNVSWATAEGLATHTVEIDGEPVLDYVIGSFPGYTSIGLSDHDNPFVVRGGRHVIALRMDRNDEVEEIYESNNAWADQYCWSPYQPWTGETMQLPKPPDPYAGWDDLPETFTPAINCSGLRSSAGSEYWKGLAAVGVIPGQDVDVFAYEALDGTRDGFRNILAISVSVGNEVDYILTNFNVEPRRDIDFGFVNFSLTGDMFVEDLASTTTGVPLGGVLGPYVLGAAELVDVYDIYLTAGVTVLHVQNLSGGAELGISLHPMDGTIVGKFDTVAGGYAAGSGPGRDVGITPVVPTDGYYGLTVWKTTGDDRNLAAEYQVRITEGLSGVGDGLPTLPASLAAHPNPFNPVTTISFSLSEAGEARIAVHDLRGIRVRELLDEWLPAGPHEVTWDGRDNQGRVMGSGTYVVRMVAGVRVVNKKVSLAK